MEKYQKKNIMFGIENPKWWVQEGDGTLHNIYSPVWSAVSGMNKFYPEGTKIAICFSINRKFVWCYEENDMTRIGKSIIRRALKDNMFISRLIGKWKEHAKNFYSIINSLYSSDFKNISDKKLYLLYDKFDKAYKIEYSLPLITDHYSFFAEKEIEKKLKILLKKKKLENNYNEYFVIMTSTTSISFANEEELHLLKICDLIKSKTDKRLIEKEIIKHVRKFYWVLNNYAYTQFLNRNHFTREINKKLEEGIDFKREIEKIRKIPENIKNKKKGIIKKLKMNKELILLCDVLDKFIHWQDQRKKAVLIANYYYDVFLKEIGRRTNIDFWDLKATLPYEIKDVIFKKKIDKKVIEERKKHSVTVAFDNKKEVFWGKKSLELYDKIFSEKIDEKINELIGIGASLGRATGKVKVITTIKDAHKMENGNVLVASMTRPEYIVLMKKASAIITNEGGLTCHAAIVSRELGIPCIIGTKIATKVLKDGDLVEVDANHGVIKIIKK